MKDKKETYIFFIICSVVWVYLFIRAFYVPIVFDEATTFFIYIQKGSFIPHYAEWDPNNHYLNSFLSIISYKIFGNSLLALRLPNLLFFPVFAYFAYKLSCLIGNKFIRIAFLASLILAHNFIEFFAFTRGYGMSMALLIASIYFLITALNKNKTGSYIKCLLLISLAVSANLNLIVTLMIVAVVLIVKTFASGTGNRTADIFKKVLVIIVFGILPVIAFSLVIFKLRSLGLLYYGDGGNFWESSLRTISKLITDSEHPAVRLIFMLLSIVVFARLIWLLIKQVKTKQLLLNAEMVFHYLYFGNLAAMVAVHHLFGVKYPEDRTGMYLFPLLIGSLIFFFSTVEHRFPSKWKAIVILPFLFFPIHFICNTNFSHSSWWVEERIPERFYNKVKAYQKPNSYPATIGGYFLKTPLWAYLNYTDGGSQNQMYASTYPCYVPDFQIVKAAENQKWLEYYTVEDVDDVSGFSLLKRKGECIKTLEYSCSNIKQVEKTDTEYYPFFEISSDSLSGKALYFCYDLNIKTGRSPFKACIVVSVADKNNNTLIWEKITLDQLRLKWDDRNSALKQNIITEKLTKEATNIKTYFWNLEKVPFSVTGQCSVYGMSVK